MATFLMLVLGGLLFIIGFLYSYALANCGGNGMDRYILLLFLIASLWIWLLQW